MNHRTHRSFLGPYSCVSAQGFGLVKFRCHLVQIPVSFQDHMILFFALHIFQLGFGSRRFCIVS